MRWLRPFFATEQPLATMNRWFTIIYGVVLLLFVAEIGLSVNVALLAITVLLLHVGSYIVTQFSTRLTYAVYLLPMVEFALLVALSIGPNREQSPAIWQIFTVGVVLNYPAAFALPFIAIGYWLYLWFVAQVPVAVDGYLLSLLNFSIVPLSLLGVRLLIEQRQRILELNQRLQAQTILMVEMSKLRERNNLAEAMHDTLGHTLTSAIVSLEGAALLLPKRPAEAVALLDSTREQLQASLGDIRQTVRTLKTDILADHTTLQTSLHQLVARVSRQTGVAIVLKNQLIVDLLPIQAYVLYTVVREGITNALKHGRAMQIQITLTATADSCITLTIADDGVGATAFTPGFGLTHLEQKVQAVGGILTVESQPQAGFCLHVVLPLALDVALQPLGKAMGKVEVYDQAHVSR